MPLASDATPIAVHKALVTLACVILEDLALDDCLVIIREHWGCGLLLFLIFICLFDLQ